jgi:hypothetical protein
MLEVTPTYIIKSFLLFLLFSFLLMLFFAFFVGLSITTTPPPQPHEPLLMGWVFNINGQLGWPTNSDNDDPVMVVGSP